LDRRRGFGPRPHWWCGSSYEPVNTTNNGEIADSASEHDSRKCVEYPISVGENWNVDVQMTSEYDNYVYLGHGGADVASNDDGDQGLNAHLVHTATEAGDYIVYACAYSDGRGAYTLAIQTSAGN